MAQEEEWKVRMDADTASMVRALAHKRGLSLNRYMVIAIREQMQRDVADWHTGQLLQLVEQGTQKTTIAANFAAIQSQAVLILLKEWRKADIKRQEGLPEDLARQKVELDCDEALALAADVFENPQVQQRYAWVERPESAEDLPDWLTAEDDEDPGN
jgi:hypothetical protein